jgi:hypothetical protein
MTVNGVEAMLLAILVGVRIVAGRTEALLAVFKIKTLESHVRYHLEGAVLG